MAYSQHTWTTGEPITQERMNHIERGIGAIDTTASQAESKATTAQQNVSSLSTQVEAVSGTASRALSTAERAEQSTAAGTNAWTQIKGVITIDPNTNTVSKSLSQVINGITDALASTDSIAKQARDDISSAIQTSNFGDATVSTFKGKIENIIAQVDTNKNQIGSVVNEISTARSRSGHEPFLNLQARMNSEYTEFSDFKTSIEDAYKSAAYGQDYTTLDARLEADENRIIDLNNSALKPEMIVNDFSSNDATKVLSAAAGRTLRNLIGGTYDAENTVTKAINTALSDAKTYADDNKVAKTDVYNDLDYTADDKHVLDARQGKALNDRLVPVETALEDALASTILDHEYESLDERLEAIESDKKDVKDEVIAARTSSVVRTPGENDGDPDTDTTYANLDARLEAIESHAAAVRTDVNTIAGELAMVDNESIVNTNTRVDTLESDLRTMAAELNMLDGTAIKDTNTRIDSIEGEIDAAHRTDEDTLSARFSAIESSVSDLNSTITNAETGLAKTKEIADEALDKANKAAVATEVTSALAGKASTESVNNLTNRVSTLESATTIIISVSDFNALAANAENSTKDYLVGPDEDNLYKYYRIIETSSNTYTKVLISGGNSGESGGGGNSSGFVYTEAQYNDLETKAENTDYYVLRADGYHHYRWVGEEEIEIDEPTKHYNIALETVESEDGDLNYLNFYEFNPGEEHLIDDDTDLTELTNNRIRRILLPATGGGGGAVNTMKITPITSRNTYNAYNSNLPVKIRFFFTTGDTGEGASYNFSVNGTTILSEPVNITSGNPENRAYTWPIGENEEELSAEEAAKLGFYEFDVGPYCQNIGTYAIKLTIALDSNTAITAEANWNVQTINLSLTSNFTNSPVAALEEQVAFTYIPSGNIEKTAHFILNGTSLPTVTIPARINTTQTYNIPAQPAGAYKLEVYLTANNGAIKTSSIYRDIIWHDTSSSDIIIASPYRGNIEEVKQYDALSIPYTVVGGNTSTYTVKYYVDDLNNSIDEVVLNNTNSGVWNYIANLTEGNHTLMIKVGEASINFTLHVTDLGIDISPVTNNLAIDFNPVGITNSSAKRLWTNGTYSLSVSDNFDWYNGGYGSDASGDYFLIKSGTRAYFDYKMFKSYDKEVNGAMTTKSTVFRDGAEMKIIFKTSAVRNAEAVWFSNIGPNNTTSAAKNVGIQLNVHNGWLRTDSADKDNVKSYLYFPYSEEDRIELDININPETVTNSVYCMSYEDGCPSRAYPYKSTEEIYQVSDNESIITIGSDDCDVYVYRFKIYNTALDTEEVLRNFIADGKDVTTCKERYERNSIYYDTQLEEYTPYEGPDTILDPERLAIKLPDVKILMLDTPIFTKSKKDFIKDSSLRCIHAPGGKVYPSRGKEDNWFFGNGYHAGQGTTSDKYGDAGRNVDFLFNCDGIHNPSDKVKDEAFVPGYQSYVIKGYGTAEQEEPEYCTDWKGDSGKISLTATSIPNNFFNLKVNIASSENVNNALFQKRYNDFLLYDSPAHQRDSRIKNDMEFVPAILFVRENKVDEQGNPDGHREFADTNWHFYALGNIGDSKKTDYTRAYDPTDENEFTLEISDNNTNNSQFQTGVYIKNGVRTIEPYTVVDDVDDDGKLTGTQSAKSEEEDITLETTAYLYPIDKETEWEAVDENGKPKNMRYWGLMNEKFDGDHSFEMRYAYLGNYRDGKLVNGDKTTANAIRERNSNVWRAFYTWLVTSSNEEFRNEIDQWCVRRSMAFFYAFTHYYTMIDNRAKNTFWHFAKTGKHRKVTQPVKALLHIYEEANGTVTPSLNDSDVFEGNFVPTTDTAVVQPYFVDQYTLVTASKFSANVTYYTYNNNQYTVAEVTAGDDIPSNIAYYTHTYVLTNDTTIQSSTVYYKLINHTYIPAEVTVGDPIKQYYTQYAFDMWAYDMDTAAGIDNNGELIFPYGKEDTDDRVDGVATSGKVFNGAGSVFWARLRENLTADITGAFTGANTSCFNAENLIAEFDKVQNCYPEAIWRLDVERKYIRSFTGDDGSTEDHPEPIYLTRQNTRFLGDMMQGRKKYQRRQWVKDQGVYFGSKYKMLNVMDSQLDMVCYTIADQSVKANWDLTITPYQDMYINVDYAETPIAPIRAKANVPVEINCPFTSMNESRIRIYGADYIRTLAGKPIKNDQGEIIGANSLASLYFRGNAFNHTNKLRELYIGSPDPTYDNSQFTTLNLNPNSPILEVLDLQNCGGLSGALPVSGCTSLKTVNIQGTSYSSIDLPSSTGIENLYLPNTMNRLILTAAKNLTNLTIRTRTGTTDNVDNLTEIIINDSDYTNNINWMGIASKALSHLINLQLINLRLASINNINELQPFIEKKNELGSFINDNGEEVSKVNLTGILNVTGNWSNVEVQQYGKPDGIWPNLEFNTNPAKENVKCEVRYYHSGYLGHETPEYITNRFIDVETGIIPDIYQGMSGDDLPSRDPTAAEIFSFGSYNEDGYIPYSGWTTGTDSSAQSLMDLGYSVNSPYSPAAGQTLINLYTYYYAEAHKYTVQWKVGDRVVKEITNQDYGGGYTLKAPTIAEMRSAGITTTKVTPNANGTYTYSILTGWEKLPTNIAPINDTEKNNSICVINAVWSDEVTATLDEIFADTTELTPEQLLVFSRISASTSSISSIAQQRRFNYQMGYSGMKEGTTLIDKNNVKRISSSTLPVNINSTVLPFSKNDGFTLAIDYQFGAQGNSTLPEVLVGCYDRTGDSVTGFALYRGFNENNGGTGTFVCYGQAPYSYDSTKHKAVGDAEHRNIIVLRHEKNSSILHIYSSKAANTSSNLNTTIDEGSNTIIDISTQNLSDNAQICIGNLRADLTTNSNFSDELNNTRGSQGSIYWMKYWNEDLGAGECLQLASWPHEDMTAIITAITSAATDSTMTRPKLYFTNLNCSSHITLTNSTLVEGNANEQETKSGGWADSNTKIICDNRIWQGLPPILQAIIGKPTIGYYNHDFRIVGSESTHSLSTLKFANNSYVYAPSVSSLDNSYAGTDTNNYGFESIYELTGKTDSTTSVITPYAWLKAGTSMISAKEYQGSSAEVKWRDISSPKAYWYNIRFNEKPVTWSNSNKLTIYKVDSSMMNNQTFYDIINQGTGIKTGDIIIYTTTNSSGTSIEGVYMYISSSEAAQKGIQTLPQTNVWKTGPANSVDGGWIKSTPYVTRSVTTGTGRYPNFIYIDQEGAINSPSNSNDQAGTGELNIDFAFTI